MFTCDEEIGADSTDLFNYLTGYSGKEYSKLLVAPIQPRSHGIPDPTRDGARSTW
jgi:polyphosphate kinase